jgi:hypothetical protein
MTTRETIECRIYLLEDSLYRRSAELDRDLHDLEARLEDLTASVHRVLRESRRIPLETKTAVIARAIETFESGTDLDRIRAEAERIASLKALVDSYERQISEIPGISPAAVAAAN